MLVPMRAADHISDADHILKPLVGSQVVAEGIALGTGDKGLGEQLTLPYGEHIYLVGPEYKKKNVNGRLVRIVGKLTIQHMKGTAQSKKKRGPVPQGYNSDFDYYQIEVSECKVIEKATLGYPEITK